ncbi:hypothetical protein BJ508DRAFT_416328 [Ascobolus immersus RN42]|uniref:Uncharacterized protein n=1 Tax=Ascobolus immersus RN42 TaxID=1160509 RepID=A0A3N4HYD2_ASCIM|nr:hypothetical protein BJ508DRAFT_416328 [Ascobolus immersus RN42]
METFVTLPAHRPPGDLKELSPENQEKWSKEKISKWMLDEIEGKELDPYGQRRTKLSHFFDGTLTPFDAGSAPLAVKWNGFPKLVKSKYQDNKTRWDICDSNRMLMDEYLEWSVARTTGRRFPDKKNEQLIQRIAFTCEGPEYWQFLADYEGIDKVFEIYKSVNPMMVKQQAEVDDLLLKNDKTGEKVYNPMNNWNLRPTNGSIAHLIHPSNTLSAEIDIAAQATVARFKLDEDGNEIPIVDADELIKCSQYGNPGRNSDPNIGSTINTVVLSGQSITIAEPVALYIYAVDTSNLELRYGPDASQRASPLPDGIISCVRGDLNKNQGLRIHVEIPDAVKEKYSSSGVDLTVSHIFDTKTNEYIMYGSQIADRITMSVSAVALPNPISPIAKYECIREPLGGGNGRR